MKKTFKSVKKYIKVCFLINFFIYLDRFMLDINEIRNRKEELQRVCEFKNKNIDISQIIFFDDKRKEIQWKIDSLKFEQKEAGKNKNFEKAKTLKVEIKNLQEEYDENQKKLKDLLWKVPNFVHSSVKFAKSEDDNEVIKKVWNIPVFDFEPKDHQELLENLWMLDKKQASITTWARFFYLKWDIARLQFAIINYVFFILQNEDILKQIIVEKKLNIPSNPFQIIVPPSIVNYKTMDRMWRLHPMDDRYCLEQDKQVLIWSAEHSLGPIFMDKTLSEKELPIRLVAYTSSFRREAGTYWKDTRWIIRTHEFHKIEMETFTLPKWWLEEQDLIVWLQEYLVNSLWLAYQVIDKCTWDVWTMDYRAFDIETWFPSQNTYRETHTADYMTDYQARRLNIKYKKEDWQQNFVHMNDATAFAIWRIIASIVENYQTKEWKIIIPEVLVDFMWWQKIIW